MSDSNINAVLGHSDQTIGQEFFELSARRIGNLKFFERMLRELEKRTPCEGSRVWVDRARTRMIAAWNCLENAQEYAKKEKVKEA